MPGTLHRLTQIELKTKLPDVKLAIDTKNEENDVLICPSTCAEVIMDFFYAHEIPYTQIDEPRSYPVDEIDRQLKKYIEPLWLSDDVEEIKELEGVTALITKFDADALFDWSLQVLLSENSDPAYRAYLDERRRESEEYYEKYIRED